MPVVFEVWRFKKNELYCHKIAGELILDKKNKNNALFFNQPNSDYFTLPYEKKTFYRT